ncbi:MAG TPA: hypothetical protein VFE93_01210, partial [Myxococcaceae bacterium]|nr:hypothetical protein [Myxococcaceae bacterium]
MGPESTWSRAHVRGVIAASGVNNPLTGDVPSSPAGTGRGGLPVTARRTPIVHQAMASLLVAS